MRWPLCASNRCTPASFGCSQILSPSFTARRCLNTDVNAPPPVSQKSCISEPVFSTAQEWVTEWFLPHFRRNPKAVRWDPQWWRHEEAGTVLEAMWGSWEATRATGDFDLKTFEVRLYPSQPVDGLRPGMSTLWQWKE